MKTEIVVKAEVTGSKSGSQPEVRIFTGSTKKPEVKFFFKNGKITVGNCILYLWNGF